MKKVLTAIGNEELNNILRKFENIKVETTDIQYQEGIIEALDKYENVDTIILKENIIGNLQLDDLINSITIIKNDIEIILIKKEENTDTFYGNNVVKVIEENEKYIEIIVQYLVGKENNLAEVEQTKIEEPKEIEEIQMTKKKFIKQKVNKNINIFQKIINYINIKRKKEAEIISFIGAGGTGKTSIIAIIAKIIKKKKVLIIDFDLINNDMYSIFGVSKYPKELKEKIKEEEFINEFRLNEYNLKKMLIKINNKINLIATPGIIFDEDIGYEKMPKILTELKEKYDVILIDTSNDTKYENLKSQLINISDKVICITEGNALQIGKSVSILKNIQEKKKVKIIYNKKDKYTISKKMLEVIFLKYKVIGSIEYNNKFNKIINKSLKNTTIDSAIKKEFENIIKKVFH